MIKKLSSTITLYFTLLIIAMKIFGWKIHSCWLRKICDNDEKQIFFSRGTSNFTYIRESEQVRE